MKTQEATAKYAPSLLLCPRFVMVKLAARDFRTLRFISTCSLESHFFFKIQLLRHWSRFSWHTRFLWRPQWVPLNWLDFGISKSLGQKLVFTFLKWSGTSLQKLVRLWTIARRTLVFASGKKVHLMKSAPFISFLLHVVVRILVFYKLDQIHSYINVVGLFVYLTFMRAKSMTAQWVSLWKTATFKVENC